MTFQVFPTPSVVSGDPASQTFGATTSGTFVLSTALAAGVYEITTDTVQSSFTLGLADADGIRYTGTIRGGKGYISVASSATRIVVPAGLTYPLNFNIRLGAYTQIAAPTGASFTFAGGNVATFTYTPPAGATNMVAYFRDGTSTTFATTTSPTTSIAIPGVVNGANGFAVLTAMDANGNTGVGVSLTSTNTANIPITGGIAATYTSGSTSYLSNTFTGSGTLTVNSTCNIEYMVVSGGGGGGGGGTGSSWNGVDGTVGGGGGAGGLVTGTRTSVAPGTYTITIGGGGAGTPSTTTPTVSSNGSSSTLAFTSAVTVVGGGGAGTYGGVNNVAVGGANGACGGGSGMSYGGGNVAGGTGSVGFNGGAGRQYNSSQGGGGGGGGMGAAGTACADNAGQAPSAGIAGAGGVGLSNSFRTGSGIFYAGGGGGSSDATNGGTPAFGRGAGGNGGGGRGKGTTSTTAVLLETLGGVNTGGGGGSGTNALNAYGLGGSGIVVVRVAL
jgi:hypothetical protein